MKVAVYTIALNEAHNVSGWCDSTKDADILLVADTGSSDDTRKQLIDRGVWSPRVHINPWRFDDARNAALSLIPRDIDWCVVLDMDERLDPGWRDEIERCAKEGATRLRYRYVWSHNNDGSDGLTFYRDGLHARSGYRWIHPVHEVLQPDRIVEKLVESTVTVHHWPSHGKDRGQYLALLEQAVKERPDDDRNTHYYARELFFNSRLPEAAAEFQRHISLPSSTWKAERASSYRYLAKCEPDKAEFYLSKAIDEDPGRREPLVDLARVFFDKKDWAACRDFILMALHIESKPLDYMCEDFAWGSDPYDYAAVSSYYLGDKESAVKYGRMAIAIRPGDARLAANMVWYEGGSP